MSKGLKLIKESLEHFFHDNEDQAKEAFKNATLVLGRKINEEFEQRELEELSINYGDKEDDITDEIEKHNDEIDAEEGMMEDETEYEDEAELDLDMEAGEDELEDDDLDLDMEAGEEDGYDMSDEDTLASIADQLAKVMAELSDAQDAIEDELESDDDMEMNMDSEDEMDAEFDFDGDMEMDADEYEDEDSEELEEATTFDKVSAPANKEGQEAGKGGTFTPNTKQNLKAKGNLKDTDAKAVMSTGGENKADKAYDKQGGVKAKDSNGPTTKGNASKVSPEGKGDKEAGNGKNVARNKKSVISKRVR